MRKQFVNFLTFFLLFASTHIHASPYPPTAVYSNSEDRIALGEYMSWLEDPKGKLGVKDALSGVGFKRSGKPVLNFGMTRSYYWLRTRIQNQTKSRQFSLEIKYPSLEELQFYLVDQKGNVSAQTGSKFKSFKFRKTSNENYEFPVSLNPGETKTVLLRVHSRSEIIMPVYFGSDQAIFQSQTNENLIYGLYFGIILVMIVYNSFLFISVKDISYIYYAVYILFVGFSQAILAGYAFRYFWPDWPWMARQSIVLMPALNGLTVAEFFRKFLDTKKSIPGKDRFLTIFNCLYIGIALLGMANFVGEAVFLLNITGLLGSVMLLWFCVILIKKGYRPARFFMIAWSFFFASIIIFILRNFNILSFNFFTDHILLFGSGAEVTLLSLALADRINILKKEKEASQALALSESQRNEQLIKDQNLTLENKVNQRTMQLRMTMDELNLTMDDLKNTQAQLVDSEKMASLGQLTAGIAHEINNPINFVTSNINPLKRDIHDIYKLLDTYEAQMPQMDADFIKGIEKLKNDLDIDYVKNEIDLLLKGIDEGANRTSEIIRGLKKFARVDEQDIKEVNLNDGFESTLLLLNSKLKDHVQVNLRLGELPKIECFAGKLNQVFMNIISNSIYALQKKFGEGPGAELDITTYIEPDSDSVHIEIRDNGTGMPEEIRARIFDPFFTTKPVGEGTGLGLSIVQKIITAHKGSIVVFSMPGEGTHFKIALPVRQ